MVASLAIAKARHSEIVERLDDHCRREFKDDLLDALDVFDHQPSHQIIYNAKSQTGMARLDLHQPPSFLRA